MKNERELINLYYDPDAYRAVLRNPFLQEGKVCATDGRILICIEASLCDGDYYEYPDGVTPPKVSRVVPQPTMCEPLTRMMLENALKKSPEEKERECCECGGGGDVTWIYTDRAGEIYPKKSTCPVCNGTGQKEKYKPIKYRYMICGLTLCYHHLYVLLKTMNYLEVDRLRIRHAQLVGDVPQPMLLDVEGKGVEIVIMPILCNDYYEAITIKE